MDTQSIVVTFNVPAEQKVLLLEILGSEASLTFLNEVPAAQRGQALKDATLLLSWNFPREISPQHYPHLQQVSFIQLLSAGADHMPFADLPPHILVASNPGAYAAPMAEHALAMTLALAKRLLVENQKLKNGEFDQFTPNRALASMTAGIIGFGGIGRATARLMRAFGMRIEEPEEVPTLFRASYGSVFMANDTFGKERWRNPIFKLCHSRSKSGNVL